MAAIVILLKMLGCHTDSVALILSESLSWNNHAEAESQTS